MRSVSSTGFVPLPAIPTDRSPARRDNALRRARVTRRAHHATTAQRRSPQALLGVAVSAWCARLPTSGLVQSLPDGGGERPSRRTGAMS